MQRIHALRSPENSRGRLAGIWTQGPDSKVHGRIGAAAQSASHVIDNRAPGFMANVLRNVLKSARQHVGCENFGLLHSFNRRRAKGRRSHWRAVELAASPSTDRSLDRP